MISGCRKRILYAFIDSFAIVIDERRLAVNRHRGSSHNAAIDMADALVPEADTEDGDFAAEVKYDIVGNASLQRGTWSRGDDYMAGSEFFDFSKSYFVIAINQRLPSQLAQILSQVVDERVVVIDDQYHGIFVYSNNNPGTAPRLPRFARNDKGDVITRSVSDVVISVMGHAWGLSRFTRNDRKEFAGII